MKDKLREEIKAIVMGHLIHGALATGYAEQIAALLDAQRCVWTHNAEYYPNLYHTACGKVLSEDSLEQRPFCPCCGKRIEVKDAR